jgi:hypothetical protein
MPFCTLCGFRPFRITLLECVAGTTGLEPATSAVTVFNDLQTRGERLKPPKSWKTARFVDQIVDREMCVISLGCRSEFGPS